MLNHILGDLASGLWTGRLRGGVGYIVVVVPMMAFGRHMWAANSRKGKDDSLKKSKLCSTPRRSKACDGVSNPPKSQPNATPWRLQWTGSLSIWTPGATSSYDCESTERLLLPLVRVWTMRFSPGRFSSLRFRPVRFLPVRLSSLPLPVRPACLLLE